MDRRVGIGILTLAMQFVSCQNSDADRVSIGMSEKDVRQALGQPSAERTNPEVFWIFIADQACLCATTKVMLYARGLSSDTAIAIDDKGRVKCVERSDSGWITDPERQTS